MRHLRIVPAAVLGLLLGFGLYSAPSYAQTAVEDSREEITVTPATKKINVDAGGVIRGEMTVINTGDKSFEFSVYARPYSVESGSYEPNYSDTPERSRAYAWVQFATTKGTLAPGKSQKISYTVTVPADTASGGHYSVLFAETVPTESDSQVVIRNKRVGSILRLDVAGDIREEGSIESLNTPWLQFAAPIVTRATLHNSGNVDYEAEHEVTVQTILGREVFSTKRTSVVYPDKPRMVEIAWDDPAWIGLYKVHHSVSVPNDSTTHDGYVLLVPRWMMVVVGMIVVAGGMYAAYRRFR